MGSSKQTFERPKIINYDMKPLKVCPQINPFFYKLFFFHIFYHHNGSLTYPPTSSIYVSELDALAHGNRQLCP